MEIAESEKRGGKGASWSKIETPHTNTAQTAVFGPLFVWKRTTIRPIKPIHPNKFTEPTVICGYD